MQIPAVNGFLNVLPLFGVLALGFAGVPAPCAAAAPPAMPVIVAIDSGLDAKHPVFEGLLLKTDELKSELPEPLTADADSAFWSGWDFVRGQAGTPDETGHGTHVAGLLAAALKAQGTPPARLLMFRTGFKRHELPAVTAALESVRSLRQAGWDIPLILCAFDYRKTSDDDDAEHVRFLAAFRKLLGSGVLCVAAAGSGGMDLDGAAGAGQYQAELAHAALLTVAACADDGQLIAASNYGLRSVALAAPGLAVESAAPGGGRAAISGSSQAAARVAAALARYSVESRIRDPKELRAWLLRQVRVHPSLVGRTASAGYLPANIGKDTRTENTADE